VSVPPSRNDSVTTRACPVCASEFQAAARRLYCSDRCRQSAHRRRHQAPLDPPRVPARRSRRPVTVYACPSCEARYLGLQRCEDCNLFCTAVGVGGCCPACEEPVAYQELRQ
jgi:hypothetical protein